MSNIAILIPSFNSRATIGGTLASLVAQQSLDSVRAVYLADDCSTDDTVATASRSWSAPFALQIVTRKSNVGERCNVSEAIHKLPSDIQWVLLLHSDDIAKPNWVVTMADQIRKCEDSVATICCSWDVLQPSGYLDPGEDVPLRPVQLIHGDCESVRGTLLRGCWWHISGCAIRVSAFRDTGDFQSDFPQLGDWEWLLRCLERGWCVEYVPRTLIVYRSHSESVSSASFRTHRDIDEALRIVCAYKRYLGVRDLARFHVKRLGYLVRRIASSLLTLQVGRAFLALRLMGTIPVNLVRSLR